MFSRWAFSGLTLMVALLSPAATSFAQSRYIFTGAPFSTASSPYTTSMSVSGFFEVMNAPFGPLADGFYSFDQSDVLAFHVRYDFFDGIRHWIAGDPLDRLSVSFSVEHGATFNMNLLLDHGDINFPSTFSSLSILDTSYEVDTDPRRLFGDTGPIVFDGVSTGTGSWAPFATPVPEPESYAMLLAGLLLLGFETRRRRKLQQCYRE
jgi:PEP-CTERM motif-containing protein